MSSSPMPRRTPNWRPRSPTPKWRCGSHEQDRHRHRESLAGSHDHPRRLRCSPARCRPLRPPARMPGARASMSRGSSPRRGVDTVAVLPLAEDDPFAAALRAVARPRPAGPGRGTRARERHDHRPRRRDHQAQPAGRDPLADRCRRADRRGRRRRARARTGSCSPDHCLPGRATGSTSTSSRAVRGRWGASAPRIAIDTSGAALRAVVGARVARPDQAERRGARRAGGRRSRAGCRARRRRAPGRPRTRPRKGRAPPW